MKTVLLVNGSPHKNGRTRAALEMLEDVFHQKGIRTEWFQLGSDPVRGCIDCKQCKKTHRCAFDDDLCNMLIEALLRADAIVIGTPVYFAGANGTLCALLDRAFYATANFGQLLKGKPAAAVAVCWRDGTISALERLNKYFSFSQMPIVSSNYWSGIHGEKDAFGEEVMKKLAENMAVLLKE